MIDSEEAKILAGTIKKFEAYWMFNETEETFEYDNWLSPKEFDVMDLAEAIGYDYNFNDEKSLKKFSNIFHVPEEDTEPKDLVESYGWELLGTGNSYNWDYHGPSDVWFYTLEINRKIYTFYAIHGSGDIRGNYTDWFVLDANGIDDVYYALQGTIDVHLTFKDNSEIYIDAQSSSDMYSFEFSEEPPRNTLAYNLYKAITDLDDLDDDLFEVFTKIED